MADILNKDPTVYQRERDAFIRDLRHFHESRGTPARKLPFINGKEFDLYLLYHLVTARGGWVKVNQRNEWGSIVDQFGTLKHCVNGEVALKQIYLRYLDRYEKIHFLGETCDRGGDDDDDSRHKRFSTRTLHPVPQHYNYHQHIVPDTIRNNGKFSTNMYQASEYDKLALSLISPLPNEQDFAINVCALLSGTNNEGKNTTLKLCNHPRLLHYLLAHAAVYNHNSLRNIMEENYKEVRGYSLKYFWSDVLEDKELSILMDEKKHVKRRQKKNALAAVTDEEAAASQSSEGDENQKYSDEESDNRLKLDPEDDELFCVGRSYGTQDFVGQRVLQVAMILRNATFIEENVPSLAQDSTFLRFVLLCCGSRWNCLHQLGFDMLSNIANEITLEDSLVDHILRIVCRGLESQDRAVILACVETLNKLGQKEENEDIMLRCIEQKVYNRICSFLSLQDIMLLIHTLECLYSLSSLGEKACNSIMHVRGAVDSLVSLITVEAQSYGPKACILMRVVETVTGDMQESEATSAPVVTYPPAGTVSHAVISTTSTAITVNTSGTFVLTGSSLSAPLVSSVPSMVATGVPNSTPPIVTVSSLLQASPLPTPAVASPVAMSTVQHARPSTPQRVIMPSPVTVAQTSTPVSVVVSNAVVSSSPATTSTAAASHPSIVATQQENENFAAQWLRSTFETHNQPGRGIEQGEMYKLYLKACSLANRKSYIAPLHFPQCVRNAFGANVGPRQVIPANAAGMADTNASKLFVYEGIQVRSKPLNVTVNPSTLTQSVRTPSSPILKAQLSSPSPPNVTKKEVKSKVSSTHPHLSNVLLNAGNPSTTLPSLKPVSQVTVAASVSTSTDSSNSTSLIKSLLANKVGDFMSPKSASVSLKNEKPILTTPHQLVLNTAVAAQVTQRQQQQQLQQHKTIQQTHVQQVIQQTETSNVHILPSTSDLQQKQQLVQVTTQPGSQPQLVQVSVPMQSQLLQNTQGGDQKPQIIQLTQQQLMQLNQSTSDKPQLVQISHPGGQQQLIQIAHSGQQLLQVCQQASQGGQQQILQLCQVKQEQSVQTSEATLPQQMILSQSGQTQQVIQMTPQLLSQMPQSVQQQLLQATQGGRTVLLQDQGTQASTKEVVNVTQTLSSLGEATQFTISPHIRQLLQDQQTSAQIKLQQTQSVGTQISQVPKIEPVAQSSTVSVITSTASANMKPYMSRINGIRNFQPVNIVIDEDKTNEASTNLLADEKLESSPELPSSSNSNDSADIPKSVPQPNTIATSKVIVENHAVSTTTTTNMVNNKTKFNDFDAELSESCSNQSLPVISIRDAENNLPSCELANENSSGLFEDFLINGKNNAPIDDTITNNLMSEDSLLNNLIMGEDLSSSMTSPENTAETVPIAEYPLNNTIKMESSDTNDGVTQTDKIKIENNTTSITATVKVENNFVPIKKDNAIQVESVETQTKLENNFSTFSKTDKKPEEKAPTKSLMLAELLEKNTERKESPIVNGALRIGERGLELISKEELQRGFRTNEKGVIRSNKTNFVAKNNVETPMKVDAGVDAKPEFLAPLATNQRVITGVKRTNDQEVQCDSSIKKPHLNGDTNIKASEEETPDESNVKASSSAANLYAALAADVLGDIDGMEEDEVPPPQPPPPPPPQPVVVNTTTSFANVAPSAPVVEQHQQLYLTTGHNNRPIFVATSPSGALGSRTVSFMGSGGQQYIMTPQTALVQGQQAVLVTQTAQQHGTGAKTIIILQGPNTQSLTTQSVSAAAANQGQKMIMQKLSGTPSPPVVTVTSSPVIVSSSLSNAIKTVQANFPSTTTMAQQQSQTTQFIPAQSVMSASSQTLPAISTNLSQITNVFSINTTNLTQTVVSTQCQTTMSQLQQNNQTAIAVSATKSSTVTPNVVVTSQSQPTPQCRQVKVIKTVPHLQPATNTVKSLSPATPTVVTSTVVATAPSTGATLATSTVTPTTVTVSPKPADNQGQFLCEWRSCMRSFKTANEVYLHACSAHCPSGSQEIQCLWERCDAMKRKRFSLMTHLYDRHCNPEILKMMAVRRKQISVNGRSEIPPPPAPPPHPGYAPNAALHAIKRHALEFVNPKELQDDNEGPVTKSIRLTSSLILRNVVIYSTGGRRYLSSFEPHLASIALSNVESSRTIAQILYDMNEHNR